MEFFKTPMILRAQLYSNFFDVVADFWAIDLSFIAPPVRYYFEILGFYCEQKHCTDDKDFSGIHIM
jgi:hypothetical protein